MILPGLASALRFGQNGMKSMRHARVKFKLDINACRP
jgi:hypothetical protein